MDDVQLVRVTCDYISGNVYVKRVVTSILSRLLLNQLYVD